MRRIGSFRLPVVPRMLVALLLLAVLVALVHHQYRALQAARAALAGLEPGPVDIGFAQAMALHHQQAITLSQLLLEVRPAQLPRLIADAQRVELGEMHGWLRLWRQPLRPPHGMDWMLLGDAPLAAEFADYLLACRRAPGGMSGMASQADLERLRQLRGPGQERLFLVLMLAHHEGGLPMARFAARQARLAAVRTLASRIVLEQSQEIARMRQMLAVLDAAAPAAASP